MRMGPDPMDFGVSFACALSLPEALMPVSSVTSSVSSGEVLNPPTCTFSGLSSSAAAGATPRSSTESLNPEALMSGTAILQTAPPVRWLPPEGGSDGGADAARVPLSFPRLSGHRETGGSSPLC